MAGRIALGPRFEAWKEKHEQTEEQLAKYLGVSVETLAGLAEESVPDDGQPAGIRAPGERWNSGVSNDPDLYQLEKLADHYGAGRRHLFDVVAMNEMRDQ